MVTLPPRVDESERKVRVTAQLADGEALWFEVDADHRALLGDRADHVALALLMPAMRAGRPLHIGGVVTDVLLHQLNHDVQALLASINHEMKRVWVTADVLAPPAPAAAGVATGFSGGVDSFAVLSEFLLDEDVPQSVRITHLLNNNVGAHGPDGSALWHRRSDRLRAFAREVDLPFVMVDSNLDAHYPLIGFSNSVTMRNAAVAHLLGGGIGRLHYASSNAYKDVRVRRTGDIALVDTLALPVLSTPSVMLTSSGSGLTRVDKTLALIGRPEARHLDVCISSEVSGPVNCSRCWKCVRTMLTLEIAGHLEEFCPEPFLMEPYLARRDGYMVELLSADSALAGEVIDFAAERGWRWSSRTRTDAAVMRARHVALREARALRNRLRPRRPA
jgi:hypothetical protein